MADEAEETLGRLKEADLWCDRYEHALQNGDRVSPSEFLARNGLDTQKVTVELLAELNRLEVAYRNKRNASNRGDTEVFKPSAAKRVGRYELLRPLGSGGFGEVWVAFDPQLDREIAIKIPHRGVLGDAASVGRFYREAKAAARLKHANIVRVHDAGSDGSTHFIAAEFIAGTTLREYCSPDGMEIREAVRIVADLASAVYYAHRNQIVHRDIKPGNILMDANNQPHLTDFGLASQLDASALTADGTVMGTPIYMAPEQAAGRFGAALPACDQYSLGTVLYELLTGRPPFSGSNSVVLYHKLNTAPPAPRTIRPEIPPEVEAICLRAMERIPEQRYHDCEALAVALRNWHAGNTSARSLIGNYGISITLGVAGLLASLFFITWIFRNPDSNPNRTEVRQNLTIADEPEDGESLEFLFPEEEPDIIQNGYGRTNGHFTITQNAPGIHTRTLTNVAESCVIEARARVRGGAHGTWGIAITSSDTVPRHSLAVEISALGRVKAVMGPYEEDPNARGPDLGPIRDPIILSGEEYNTLQFAISENVLTVSVNGTQLGGPVNLDRKFTPGMLSMFARRSGGPGTENPITAEFQRVRCWKPSESKEKFRQQPIDANLASQPPTPPGAKILDATHQLPLHPCRRRKVVDFAEIHGAGFEETSKWLKCLGPDYCPCVLGEHVSANPPQYHAIAYRVTWPVQFRVDATRSLGEETKTIDELGKTGHHALAFAGNLHADGPEGDFLRTSSTDIDYIWYTAGNQTEFSAQMKSLKERNFRPILIIPKYAFEEDQRLIVLIGAHDHRNWEAAENLTIESLKEFAEKAKTENRFLFQIRGEQTDEGQIRFYAITLDNPDQREWDYQCDMSTTEYEAELIRRKAMGFRPTTVTSYGEAEDPKYAAAWIRYFEPSQAKP